MAFSVCIAHNTNHFMNIAMNFPLKFVLFIKCIIITTVYTKSLESVGKIVGGYEATPNSHPYLVSLQTRFLWIRAHVCGGTILNERWILTAAHCARESWLIRLLPMDAVAGAHDVNEFGPKAQVKAIGVRMPHPLYDGGIGPHDIAVLQTVSPFTFTKEIKPIRLPTDSYIRSQHLSLVGWGVLRTTVFIPDTPSKLQEVKVSYVPYDECNTAINELLEGDETNPLDDEANICTGPLSGGVAACSGDSGGPLVHYVPIAIDEPNDSIEESSELDDTDRFNSTNEAVYESAEENDGSVRQYKDDLIPVVVGVVSWGVAPCGIKGAPTVYTNVTNYKYFINYFINNPSYP